MSTITPETELYYMVLCEHVALGSESQFQIHVTFMSSSIALPSADNKSAFSFGRVGEDTQSWTPPFAKGETTNQTISLKLYGSVALRTFMIFRGYGFVMVS
eukprot:4986590-Amphidinium_carterae.1